MALSTVIFFVFENFRVQKGTSKSLNLIINAEKKKELILSEAKQEKETLLSNAKKEQERLLKEAKDESKSRRKSR